MTCYAPNVPGFVRDFLGASYARLRLDKIGPGVFSLWSENGDRALLVAALTPGAARDRMTEFVCVADPKTDRRRRRWFYT